MKFGTVDYASSYFKHKTPMPIIGPPTHKLLKRLKKELQANTSSIEYDLGGVNHRCLGLILTYEEHATIPNTQPFEPPTHPSPLDIAATATAIQAL